MIPVRSFFKKKVYDYIIDQFVIINFRVQEIFEFVSVADKFQDYIQVWDKIKFQ